MSDTVVVRAYVDSALKSEAAAVLAGMGLTVSDVVRATLAKVAKDKTLPFKMRVPNATTVRTIKKSDRGVDVHSAKDAKDLFRRLGI